MTALYIIVGLLGSACLFIVGLIVIDIVRSIIPYPFFKLHAFFVKKGLYTIKRKDAYFKITSFFVTLKVQDYRYDNKKVQFDLDGGTHDFFEFYYNKETNSIENFSCSENFAKSVKNKNMMAMLAQYVPYILKREYGKKSDRVQTIEKMNELGKHFVPQEIEAKKENKKEQKEEKIQSLVAKTVSPVVQLYVQKINQIATKIQENKRELAVEEQHAFDMLLTKRLPNLLQHADFQEKEVISLLKEVLDKMETWHTSIVENETNDFEKEKILIQKMIQR